MGINGLRKTFYKKFRLPHSFHPPYKPVSPLTRGRTVENQLYLESVTREDLHAELSCHVANNNISSPIVHAVHIDMNCE